MAYNLRPYTDSIYVLSQIVNLQNKELKAQIQKVKADNEKMLSTLAIAVKEVDTLKLETATLSANLKASLLRSDEWKKKYRKTKINSIFKEIGLAAIIVTGAIILIQR